MSNSFRALSLAGVLFAASAYGQQSVEQVVADRTLTLVIPKGHCMLQRDSEEGRGWYDFQEKGNEGRNRVLLLYVSCEELRELKRDNTYRVKSHGSYLAALTKGKLAPLSAQYTRPKFISEMKRVFPKIGTDKVENIVSNRIREMDFDKQLQVSGLQMGYLAEDEAALYVGMGSWVEAGQDKVRVINIIAMTLLSNMMISSNMYAEAGRKESFKTLLPRQKELMRLLVSRN